MELKNDILNGLALHLESEKVKAKVGLDNYLHNSAGIGEQIITFTIQRVLGSTLILWVNVLGWYISLMKLTPH